MDDVSHAHKGWQLHGPHRDVPFHQLPDDFVPLRLILEAGGLCVELNKPDMQFGRHSDMDVRLALPDISRRHCRFVFQNGYWKIVDLESLNGVYVNEERMHEATLYDGDQVRIGTLVFTVSFGNEVVAPVKKDVPLKAVLKSIADVLPPPSNVERRKAS